eukprot:SAG22_NODE_7140_length_772_cov_0.741456_1_plen_91_part_10
MSRRFHPRVIRVPLIVDVAREDGYRHVCKNRLQDVFVLAVFSEHFRADRTLDCVDLGCVTIRDEDAGQVYVGLTSLRSQRDDSDFQLTCMQ